jgi:membrane-bound lytic murein transglycosylase B
MRGSRRLLATFVAASSLLVVAPAPHAGAQSAAPAPAPAEPSGSATGLASRITDLNAQLTQLQARIDALTTQLADAEKHVQDLSSQATGTRQVSSELVAAARRQALAAYVFADPAASAFTLAQAVTEGDVNDVAWSLGLLRASHAFTRDLLARAAVSRGDVDQDLLDAIKGRDDIALELNRSQPTVESAKNDLKLAELALDSFVVRLGPSTIAGMTTVAFEAYRRAAEQVATEQPACGIRWELLAAIGKTESNHGAGRLDTAGNTSPAIIGIPIGPDTDGGALDLDPTKDHAVGPMQFIPSTWRTYGADGNGDAAIDPNNIWDATLTAARYLCQAAGTLTLNSRDGVVRAILAYNPNQEYLRVVGGRFEALARDVASGWFSTASLPVPEPTVLTPGVTVPVEPSRPPLPADTPAPVAAPTEVRTVSIATAGGLAVNTAGAPEPGTCYETSAVLSGRAGYLRCQTTPAAGPGVALDPCQVAPFDPTLVACLPDPQAPAHLLRMTGPAYQAVAAAGPPFFGLVLDGNDRCLPVTGPTTRVPAPALGTLGATRLLRQTDPGDGSSTVPDEPTTEPPSTDPPTDPPTTPPPVTDPPTTPPPVTEPPTTPPPVTDPPTTPPPVTDPPTTPPPVTDPTTTQPPVTDASTTTVATTVPVVTAPAIPPTFAPPPAPPGATYVCGSGAYVVGQPDRASSTWQVTVSQTGIANRNVAVLIAFV